MRRKPFPTRDDWFESPFKSWPKALIWTSRSTGSRGCTRSPMTKYEKRLAPSSTSENTTRDFAVPIGLNRKGPSDIKRFRQTLVTTDLASAPHGQWMTNECRFGAYAALTRANVFPMKWGVRDERAGGYPLSNSNWWPIESLRFLL